MRSRAPPQLKQKRSVAEKYSRNPAVGSAPRVVLAGSKILVALIALCCVSVLVVCHWHIDQTNLNSGGATVGLNLNEFVSKQSETIPSNDLQQTISNHDLQQQPLSFPTAPEFDTDGKTRLHIVFSTDCSEYQHWQSYTVFFRAMKIGQPGHVTRIASGCTDKEAEAVKAWHEEHVTNAMSSKFGVHFTPHFSAVKDEDGNVKGDYEFFNKPYGLEHWMENGEGMGIDPATGNMKDEDMVIILLDPDQALLNPIGTDFSEDRGNVIYHEVNGDTKNKQRVKHGSPFAATYGFGDGWRPLDIGKIAGEDSPAKKVSAAEARDHYAVGPPYVATARDMYNIAVKWAEFVPEVHKQYPKLLAEMFAFCIAAAHLQLPHQLVDSLMVSDAGIRVEGWKLIDEIPGDEVCENAVFEKYPSPFVIHFCQRYMAAEWFFGKRKLPKDFFTCEHPLLQIPPKNLATEFNYKILPAKKEKEIITPRIMKHESFMICAMTSIVNEASEFFKMKHCSDNKGTRFDKSMNLFQMF